MSKDQNLNTLSVLNRLDAHKVLQLYHSGQFTASQYIFLNLSTITRQFDSFVKKFVPHETWNWTDFALVGIILLIPFSIRYIFDTPVNFQTGAYSDFTAISLYLSQILTLLITFHWIRTKGIRIFTTWFFLTIFWLILELILQKGENTALQGYYTWWIIVLITFSYFLSRVSINKLKIIPNIFVWLGVFQSFLAIYQFITQKSLGLYLLGESHLDPNILGVAKFVAHGTKYIRSYGTFPHANLLAAFLVMAIILNLYLLTKNYQKRTFLIYSIALVINIFGLFLTFSRGGLGVALIGLVGFFIFLLITKRYRMFLKIGAVAASGVLIALLLLSPYLSSRATISDDAVREREFYNQIGWKMVKSNPVIGVGPGVSVLHMEQYSDTTMEPWEIQPIHNFYLLALAEWGIGGIFLLLLIIIPIATIIMQTIKQIRSQAVDFWTVSLALIGVSILILFLFDHYFYTIWPTQLLLWFSIGLIMATINMNKKELQ